jgi:DNA polymerase-1
VAVSPGPLLIVDGHSLAYRAFYGYPVDRFSTSSGQHTNAVFGFITMFCNLVQQEHPGLIGVAFDRSRVSFRTAVYPAYKATRTASPEEFKGQVDLIKSFLDAVGVHRFDIDNFEGDDIVATWTSQATVAAVPVLISSGDRDSFQLVNSTVTVLYPGRDQVARMTPAAIEAKYGVSPQQYPDLAALVGETSDNLPGVPGVGPKTAAKWIKQFGDLERLLEQAGQVPGKAGESLRAHIDDVRRNRQLNALVRDVPVDVNAVDLLRGDGDMNDLTGLFDSLEFGGIRERVRQIFPVNQQELPSVATGPSDQAKLAPAIDHLAEGEFSDWLAPGEDNLAGLQFTVQSGRGHWHLSQVGIAQSADGPATVLDLDHVDNADLEALKRWLADATVTKSVNNAKEALVGLWQCGWDLKGVVCDTALAAYLINPDRRVFDVPALTMRYLGQDIRSSGDDQALQPSLDLTEQSVDQRLAQEACSIAALTPALLQDLDGHHGQRLLTDLELPLSEVLARMELVGVAVDRPYLVDLSTQFDAQVQQAQQAAFDAIGHPINLSSPKQLQTVLFDELHMPKTRKTKSGYTTDAEALETLYQTTEHPFLEHLLAHRDAIKLRQIVDGLIKSIGEDGRIHTTFSQTAAATGRLSSIDPNLQNIPARSSNGQQIRQAFVPGPGFESLMTADYSQIEMRIMADVSGDQRLIEAFQGGEDFHTVMAAHVFHLDPDQVTPAQRSRVKAVNYGLAYGLSPYGLASQLKITVPEAKALTDEYFTSFGKVRQYLTSLVDQATHTGYTQTLLGRRRYLPDLTSTNRTRREMAERMALNAPIQGTAADIIKLAMLKVDQQLSLQGLASRLLLQVHDELIFEVAPGEAAALEQLVRQSMADAMVLKVPLDVSVGVGENWSAAAH